MISISKKLLSVILLTSIVSTMQADPSAGVVTGTPYFFTRSQSRNKVLQDVASIGHTHLYDMDACYGTFDIVLAYEHSFRGNINDALFGAVGTGTVCQTTCKTTNNCENGRTFAIQGSGVAGRDSQAWLAEYFYLPTDFSSTITFKPRITNTLIFLDYFQGLDECLCGLYFRIYGPITFSRWDVGFCENVINRGTTGYIAGYFTPTAFPAIGSRETVAANTLLPNFSSYALGDVPQGLIIPGSVNPQPLKYAKIQRESHKKTGFADLRLELGWDFWQSPCHHLGFNIQGAAPTGSRPDAEFFFQPVVGNGKHWELGGGMIGHYNLYMNQAETTIFSFWFDANITHLFKARQQRTFDLRNNPISRYILAERLGTPVTGLFANPSTPGGAAGAIEPVLQFQSEYAPVANLTTTDVKVSIDVQADIVAWFNMLWCNWSLDIGYNFWGTSCEKINLDSCNNDCKNLIALCNASQAETWALKGDAQMYGFTAATVAGTPLSATESGAAITGGTNVLVGAPINSIASTNAGVDSAAFAQTTASTTALLAPNLTTQIRTSLTPVTLSCSDINFTSNKGLSHKVFAHLGYAWECECWIPYLGIGGSAEFAQRTNKGCCPITCPANNTNCAARGNCMRSGASLWSVWLKGGVSF